MLGVFAATLVAARLMKLSPGEALDALGIAGSAASGLMAYLSDGSDAKQLHAGWAAMSGIRSARLARAGFRGPAAVFEHKFGVFRSFADVDVSGKWRTDQSAQWEVQRTSVKPYPACHAVHAVVEAAIDLRSQLASHSLTPRDIEDVECSVPQWYVNLVFEPAESKSAPRTSYECRFSAPWCFARTLLDGNLTVWSFGNEELADPQATSIARRVRYAIQDFAQFPSTLPAHVKLSTRCGRTLSSRIEANLGSPMRPMSSEEVNQKFMACASPAIGRVRSERLASLFECMREPAHPSLFSELRALQVQTAGDRVLQAE